MTLEERDLDAIRRCVKEVLDATGTLTKLERLESAVILPRRLWWTRQQCCELKGISIETVSRKPHLLPNFGVAHRVGGGRLAWHWSEVEPWLAKDDEALEREYRVLRRSKAS